MRLHIKWFSLSTMIVVTVPSFILFIWCASNGFGAELVRLFESIHPSGGLSIVENMAGNFTSRIPGIAINTVYVAVDSFIAGFAFSLLYNTFVGLSEKE